MKTGFLAIVIAIGAVTAAPVAQNGAGGLLNGAVNNAGNAIDALLLGTGPKANDNVPEVSHLKA